MTDQNATGAETRTPEATIHHQTKRAADLALAKKQISPDSHQAVLEGRITLEEARELGRNAGPGGPAVRVNKNDRSRPCVTCGGLTRGGRFHPGCDMKMHRIADEYLRDERELTDEQREYLEESGKLEQARKRAEKQKAKAETKAERKAEREAKKAKK